jgi:hypothetical protein
LPQRAARQPAFKSAPASTKAKGAGKKPIKKEKKLQQVAPATACLSLAFPMQN